MENRENREFNSLSENVRNIVLYQKVSKNLFFSFESISLSSWFKLVVTTMASYYYHSFSFSFFLWWTIRLMIQVHSLHLHHNLRHYSHCRGVQQRQHKHNAVIGDCDCDDVNANNNNTNDTNDTKKNSNSCRIKEPSLYVRCPDYPSFAYYGKGEGVRRVSLIDAAKRKEDNDTVDEGLVSSSSTTTAPEQLFGKVSSLSSSSIRSSPSFIESDFNFFRAKAKKRRLLDRRSYASSVPFEKENRYEPPTLDDLKPPPFPLIESIWISTPYRIATFALAYFLFPYVTGFLNSYTTMEPDLLSEIVSKFGPGVSVLYGTFISLTLSILYGRQKDIQNDVAVESSLLGMYTLHVHVPSNILFFFVLLNGGISTERPINSLDPNNLNKVDLT